MLYKKNQEKQLDRELFLHPTSEYRGTPFWAWNCKITKELIADQMEGFRRMGFGGAHLHARTGLETDYMSAEFLDMVKYTDECAKDKDMLCWLYDEDRFPSGSAGGIVTENMHYRARYMLLTRERKEGMMPSGEAFNEAVTRGEKPAGYYVTSYRIRTDHGYLVSYRQISGAEPLTDSEEESVRDGKLWLAYMELMPESPWYNDQTYVDAMNKEAIERFIEVTHERYYKELGEEFGKSVPAIFTDEPQIRGALSLPDGESDADVTLCFTDDLDETFKEEYGVSLLDVVPELLWELPDGKASVHRYHYHDHLAERFVSAFSDTIADWCGEHGINMTGHYMSEPTLYSQTLRLGEAMRCYRRQQLPGVDILCGDPEYSTIKQAASVTHQNGKEGLLSELYGVTHWDFDFKGHKLQGDWQAALGVTVRVPHLAFMSMEGEAKRDWPASINYQSPWYEKYSYVEDYFARVNTALTRGKADIKVAVVHPIESYWISFGPVAETRVRREQMDSNFRNIIEWLLFGLIDFDFLSESMLPEQNTRVEEKHLKVGQMEYQTVLVPGLRTIRNTTLDYLEKFVQAGGRVIFLGDIPTLVDGLESDRAFKLSEKTEKIPYQQSEVLETLSSDRSLEIRDRNGDVSANLFYQLRQDNDCKWLFVCHVNRKRNRLEQAERYQIKVRGCFSVTCYDALSGEIYEIPSEYIDGWTCVDQDMYAEDSFLWKLTRAEVQAAEDADKTQGKEPVNKTWELPVGRVQGFYGLVAGSVRAVQKPPMVLAVICRPESYTLAEPNVLLLDQARWRLDAGEWQPKEEILRIDNQIRTILGYPHREDQYIQPWRVKEAPEKNTVMLCYEIFSQIEAEGCKLAIERPDKAEITLNGIVCEPDTGKEAYFVDSFIRTVSLPGIRKGVNELVVKLPFGRKTNLENLFLLGEFGVEVYGTQTLVTERADTLYFGDITRQKMPFYGGSLMYHMEFVLKEEQEICVRVPHFAAPVLGVCLDGAEKGVIAYAPHVLPLGRVSAGIHKLIICAYGNRFNSFGTLHNCNDEFKWYNSNAYRTTGCEWSESFCLRPFGILSRVEILQGSEGK